MEPEEQWRIVWSQGQVLNNTERRLLFPNCSLIVPYKVNQGIQGECSSEMQQGASPAGEAQQAGVSHCSVNKLGACWEPRAPAETFIFLSAVTTPPLINACPGVFFTEAQKPRQHSSFFKRALLIGGGCWKEYTQAEANVYTVPFLTPSSQRDPQDPWGAVSLSVAGTGCLPRPSTADSS